jgi:hypothetical protein
MKNASEKFIQCLKNEEYFDAHEALEEIWFPIRLSNHPEKNMIRGLINAAVSFELHKRNRPDPSKRVFATYQKYLSLIESCHSENRVYYDACIKQIEETFAKLSL